MRVGMLLDGRQQIRFGKGIKLLHENNRRGFIFALLPLFAQFVADLARAEQNPRGPVDVLVR